MEKQQGKWKRQMRWIKEGMKNFRLSLSLRVSLNYLRFFLINGLIFFFFLGFLYVREEMKPSMETVEQMIVLLEMDDDKFISYASYTQPENMEIAWREGNTVTVLYEGTGKKLYEKSYWFGFFHAGKEEGKWHLYLQDREKIFRKGQEYQVYFYYDLSESLERSVQFLRDASIVYLILMLFVIWENRRENKRI